jgi:hypothetical protein
MKLRRLAAVVSAAVLALGMVTAVSAHRAVITTAPVEGQCQNENGQPIECPSQETQSQEPSTAPSQEPSSEPSSEPSQEPSSEPSTEPSDEASVEPTEDASSTPSEQPSDGQVEGLTSQPTLPPTDTLSQDSTNSPDGTLPLVLIVLGVIGLSVVVLTPVRTRR